MLRVCVIFGGASSEHAVSLRSSTCVLEHIDRTKYEVVTIGITREGQWYHYDGPVELIATGQWEKSAYIEPAIISPDPSEGGILLLGAKPTASQKLRGKILTGKKQKVKVNNKGMRMIPIDMVFPVLHGKNGEDGTIQGLFDLAELPYVGCGVLSSANCMDKEMTHIILERAGVPKTKLVALVREDVEEHKFEELEQQLKGELGYPMFVKPANAGSSVGVSKVKESSELEAAMTLAFKHDKKIVVEKAMVGRELECAVWGNEHPNASHALGEIIPTRDFYDYDGKYEDNSAGLVAPAVVSEEDSDRIREIAMTAYKAMECRGLARVDFFLQEDGPVLNEINTMPGFTSISMFPRLFVEDGLTICELIDNLIYSALER